MKSFRFIALAAAATLATTALAADPSARALVAPTPVQDGDDPSANDGFPSIEEFQLPDETRETIEQFLGLIGPMIERFGAFVDDLPRYAAPEVLPNGDIIIRRIDPRDEYPPFPGDPDADGTTKI